MTGPLRKLTADGDGGVELLHRQERRAAGRHGRNKDGWVSDQELKRSG